MVTQLSSFLSEEEQEVVYTIAHAYYRQGQHQLATPLLRTLTVAHPRSCKFWVALGASYQASRDYEKALECYEKACLLNPEDFRIHFYAAHCFFALQKHDQGLLALNWAEEAIQTQPKEKRHSLQAHIQLLRQAWKKEKSHGTT